LRASVLIASGEVTGIGEMKTRWELLFILIVFNWTVLNICN
jgi:hypothetical protein